MRPFSTAGLLSEPSFLALSRTDPDERFDYMLKNIPSVTEDDLCNLIIATERWLDDDARKRISVVTLEFIESRREPADIFQRWLTEHELKKFTDLLDQAGFPDRTMAISYALCRAQEVTQATYFIQHNRKVRPVDFTKIEQTPEDIEADLRFVNSRYEGLSFKEMLVAGPSFDDLDLTRSPDRPRDVSFLMEQG